MVLIFERLGKKYLVKIEETEKTYTEDSYYYESETIYRKKVWIIGPDTAECISYYSRNKLEVTKKVSARLIGKIPSSSYDISYIPEFFNLDEYTGIDIRIPEYVIMSDDFSDVEKARCIVFANQVHYNIVKYSESPTIEFENLFKKLQCLIWTFGNEITEKYTTISEIYEKVFNEFLNQSIIEVNNYLEEISSQNVVCTSARYKDKVPFYLIVNKIEKQKIDIVEVLADIVPKNKPDILNYLRTHIFERLYFMRLNSYNDLRDLLWNEEIAYHIPSMNETKKKNLVNLHAWKNAIYKWNAEYDEHSSPGISNDFIENVGLREQMEILPLKEYEEYWVKELHTTKSISVEFCTYQKRLSETIAQLALGGTLGSNKIEINKDDVNCCRDILNKRTFNEILQNIWTYDFSHLKGYNNEKMFYIHQENRHSGFIIREDHEKRYIAFALRIF